MSERRRRFAQGLAWTGGYQIFEAATALVVMLVVVRIIPPSEYGRAASATGIVGFLNLLSARAFIEHALQVADDREADWTTYWGVMWYVQVPLFVLGNAAALAIGNIASLSSVAALVHLGSIGFLIDGVAHINLTMMRRSLDISRLRRVLAASVLLKLVGTLVGALAGFGAAAIVASGTILPAVPLAVDLFTGQRFRARWPRPATVWNARDVFRYGTQRTAGGVLGASRALIEGTVLPGTIGLEAFGLLGRAQAVFSVTVGRLVSAFSDTAFPFVARAADDRDRFGRWTGVLFFGTLVLSFAGSGYLMAQRVDVIAVLYGSKWSGVVPLVIPGVAAALGGTVITIVASTLLAKRQVRRSIMVDGAAVILAIVVALLTFAGAGAAQYLTMLATANGAIAAIGLTIAARAAHTTPSTRSLTAAAAVSAVAAAGGSMAVGVMTAGLSIYMRVVITGCSFAVVYALTLWLLMPHYLSQLRALLVATRQTPERVASGAPLETAAASTVPIS